MNTTAHKKPRARGKTQDMPEVTSFRLPETERRELAKIAATRKMKSNLVAPEFVLQAMRRGEKDVRSDLILESLRRQVQQLRADLCLVTEVLLHAAGKATREQSSSWVDSNLKPPLVSGG